MCDFVKKRQKKAKKRQKNNPFFNQKGLDKFFC